MLVRLRRLAGRFGRFGVVGFVGFGIDTGVVYALHRPLGAYLALVASYLVAATANWALNRYWTFADRPRGVASRQWGLFLLTNILGFVLNRGTSIALVRFVPICARQLVLATAGGAVAGMGVNFVMANRVVYR